MKKSGVYEILRLLHKQYPELKCALNFKTTFELLVAVILSAQCTDKRVNIVTEKLFLKYNTPKDFVNLNIEQLEKLIYSTGFYRNKAKNISNLSEILVRDYDLQVPSTLEELVNLPGVGRKTANVILGEIFKIPSLVVDTHVKRLSNLIGLTVQKDPVKIEIDLMTKIPKIEWINFSHMLILHGRSTCIARRPQCDICIISKYCKYYNNI